MADMTWSILARDRDTGQFGIAVATRFFAVGALVPHAKSRIGAIATQALVNPFYGTEGLRLLEQGKSARDVVRAITAVDAGRDHRQVHVLDAQARIAAHTGKKPASVGAGILQATMSRSQATCSSALKSSRIRLRLMPRIPRSLFLAG